ncbi:hypothetical protein RN001_013568 [Aquatica leii]|uniref:Double-strand break repair protein n=1 Tax=Aquatica leii TaxID=1421715 RepID=A0AAN7P302_9COLE|nr:hypothetical protein RN001_013568 [Aquatica leii]
MDNSMNALPEDTFKILIATDNHLGYSEKNAIRGQDSFKTFEEILELASVNKVDFILLGGDLFHDSRPSTYCIYNCIELLRKYCLGDKPVEIEFLPDQSYRFQRNRIVNYEDPNLNVSIPVFTIHGKHDDPTGNKQISVLDILAASGLINYFGRCNDFKKVDIKPILLQKGEVKLAIYGLSHIKDERLGRLFLDRKVTMKMPQGEDWFNILVLHQNRVARGVKNFIPESAIPDFIDLVIWGHEHDCKITPEPIGNNNTHISQPGSSIATSLALGESIPKKVALLQVSKDGFKMIPIPLQTVRPFILDELFLENPQSENYLYEKPSEQAVDQVKQKINEMIAKATTQHKDKSKPAPLPLIRLKVFYHNEQQMFNTVRIGMQFSGRVANPDDMVKLNSITAKEKKAKSKFEIDEDELEEFVDINSWATSVEDIIVKCLSSDEKTKEMTVLSTKDLVEAVSGFIKHGNSDVISNLVKTQIDDTVNDIVKMDPEVDQIAEAIETLRDQRIRKAGEGNVEAGAVLQDLDLSTVSRNTTKQNSTTKEDSDILELFRDDKPSTSKAPPKKKNAPRGRGSRGGRGSRSRGKQNNSGTSY